ncbi:APC family permease [Candidatus Nesciobacter abundans]|uniref:APC family permease n=1 Tax=Candidatus Nesciobacter abundans TaxID=2601668 RepID=UPI001653A53B|nr:amino acid permease [Candidatus Nesciobacter abundans]
MRKKINFLSLNSFIIGNIIGSGVLLLPSSLARFGSFGIYAYFLSALAMFSIGMVFFKLQTWTGCQGVHGPIKSMFGEKAGAVAAFVYWLSVVFGNGSMIATLFSYMGLYSISFSKVFFYSFLIMSLITLANSFDIRMVEIIEIAVAFIKVIPLLVIPMMCFYKAYFSEIPFPPVYDFNQAIYKGIPIALWAFLGIETAVIISKKVENPEKNIPRALTLSLCIISLIYMLGFWVMVKLIPNLSSSTSPYADLLCFILPNSYSCYVGYFIRALSVMLILGTIYGWVFTSGIIIQDSANEGLMPRIFAKQNKFGSPAIGLWISSVLSTLFITLTYQESILSHFELMTEILVLMTFSIYLFANFAFFSVVLKQNKKTFTNLAYGAVSLFSIIFAMFSIIKNIL